MALEELLAENIFLAFRWILILLYPNLCCIKNVLLIAAIIMWSVETFSDWFSVQLFRTHLSGWHHIFRARVTVLQLQNNSSEVVKINWTSSPPPGLHMVISLRAASLELPWVHLSSCLMLTLLYCPAQWSELFPDSVGWGSIESLPGLNLVKCFQFWLHRAVLCLSEPKWDFWWAIAVFSFQ